MNHKILAFLLGATALLSFFPDDARAQISSAEREALIDFYHATGGDVWDDNTWWLAEPGSECNWHGVHCAMRQTDNSFVVRLTLEDNNLSGQLPDSLAGLDRLTSLYLQDNELGGQIPSDLWGLSSLERFSLRGNRFTGSVPSTILTMQEGHSSTFVDLSENLFEGFEPAAMPSSPSDREIDLVLGDNRIRDLPPAAWRASGAIQHLDLSGNRIEGELVLDDGPWHGLRTLDLAGNRITGLVGGDLPDLETLDLAWNHLSDLPDFLLDLQGLSRLELGNNRLAGELPEWFADMNLGFLGLDNNDLWGPVARVFAALDTDNFPQHTINGILGLHLHIANNRFTGPLPDVDFERFNRADRGPSSEFGLDLCFNPIELAEPERLELIAPVHRGRALAPCLGRDQAELDRTISGSWYHPERSGEGITQLQLDNGSVLHYWFTYAPEQYEQPPEQMWLLGLVDPGAAWSEFRPLWITRGGLFGAGIADGVMEPGPTWARHNRTGPDTMHFMYHHDGGGICITGACSSHILSERFDLTRLTNLAGTSCENQSDLQQYSGAWYNPERAGEGFIVEVLPDDRIVVYWFTYTPDGSGQQAWMIGDGGFLAKQVVLAPAWPWQERAELTLYQPTGGNFGRDFDPDEVQLVEWGDFIIEFNDEDTGRIEWNSDIEGYGSGEYPIERLAQPMLAECEQGERE